MSLPRPSLRVPRASSLPPPEDPDSEPPRSKRLRLEELGAVPEARWRLPLVPRLSEEEKIWVLPPRPFKALLESSNENFDDATESCVEKPVSGRQICHLGRQNSKFQTNNCLQSLLSQNLDSGLRASSERSFARGLTGKEVFCARDRDGPKAEAYQSRSDTSLHGILEIKNANRNQYLVQDRSNSRKDNRYLKQAENPFVGATFYKEAKATLFEMKTSRKADRIMPSHKNENNMLASILKMPKCPNQPNLEIAKPCYFRDNSTTSIPEFPADLNSKMSSVYLKEIAKKRNNKNETYVKNFTNISCSQNRADVTKQKLQNGNKISVAENTFSKCYENNHQSFSQLVTCKSKQELITFNYYNHSSNKYDENNITIILENIERKETEIRLDAYIPTKMEKSQISDYNTRCILKRNRESCWIMDDYENMKINEPKLNLQQLLEIVLLNKEGCYNTGAMNAFEKQLKPFARRTLDSQKASIKIVYIIGKEENDNMPQSRFSTTQGSLHLSNIFESCSTEFFCFHKNVLGSQKDYSILACYETLKCKKKTEIQYLITMNKNDDISIYIQNSFSESLNVILKANESLTKIENVFELEKEYVFRWIVYLNYPEINVVENHSAHLTKILTFSWMSEDNIRPMLKEIKLFENEDVFEGPKKQTISSFKTTAKNVCFPIFETHEKIPLLMDFGDVDDIYLTTEISYKSHCPEGIERVENWAHFTVKKNAKSDCQFIQNCQRYTNEKFYEINMYKQNSDPESNQEHAKITSFNSECISEDFLNIKQQVILANRVATCGQQTKTMTITEVPNFGNWLSEIKEKTWEVVLKEEMKTTAQSLTKSCQVHKDSMRGKEEKDNFSLGDSMFSIQSVSLMSKKLNVEDATQTNQICVNQNDAAHRSDYESIFQESELANSKRFHPKNDSTEYVNHQFEAELSPGNNECFQDLAAKCLSTEALTRGKDFEMRSKFDLVLEELRMFHEISKEKEILSTAETNTGQENPSRECNAAEKVAKKIKEDLKGVTATKTCAPSLSCDTRGGLYVHKRHHSSFKWKREPSGGEQEVPDEYYPRISEEKVLYSTFEEECERPLPQKAALYSGRFKEERSNYLLKEGSHVSHGILRIHPLKTCSRPIRIGLSRKAKPKQLHPYLK